MGQELTGLGIRKSPRRDLRTPNMSSSPFNKRPDIVFTGLIKEDSHSVLVQFSSLKGINEDES